MKNNDTLKSEAHLSHNKYTINEQVKKTATIQAGVYK